MTALLLRHQISTILYLHCFSLDLDQFLFRDINQTQAPVRASTQSCISLGELVYAFM